MSAITKSTAVFVTLSGLFWTGWVVGSQTPAGQEALARVVETYNEQQAVANESLFDSTALRVIVCGDPANDAKPCMAVFAGGHFFVVDAGSGTAASLAHHNIPMGRLDAVLLTDADMPQTADLSAVFSDYARGHDNPLLAVFGPADTQRLVDGMNQARGHNGLDAGLQAWGPSPEPGSSVIVFQGDGLTVSAFTTEEEAFNGRVAYRFDYRGRSVVIGGDGRMISASAARDADVVLQNAQSEALSESASDGVTAAEVALDARAANAGMVVLTGADNQIAAQVQVSEARATGFDDVISGRVGLVLELPLTDTEVNVRSL
jgi:ribonuclease Z